MIYLIFYTCFVLTQACPEGREGCLLNHMPYEIEVSGKEYFDSKEDLESFIEKHKMKEYKAYKIEATLDRYYAQ